MSSPSGSSTLFTNAHRSNQSHSFTTATNTHKHEPEFMDLDDKPTAGLSRQTQTNKHKHTTILSSDEEDNKLTTDQTNAGQVTYEMETLIIPDSEDDDTTHQCDKDMTRGGKGSGSGPILVNYSFVSIDEAQVWAELLEDGVQHRSDAHKPEAKFMDLDDKPTAGPSRPSKKRTHNAILSDDEETAHESLRANTKQIPRISTNSRNN